MSVSGVSSSSFFDFNRQSIQNRMQQFRQEFQQLGEDLASGNLSGAQSDFVVLQKLGGQSNANSASQANPIAQAFQQLATDLQSGNLTAAQQDLSTLTQDMQSQAAHGHHRHHHGGGQGAITQAFSQLGQALQAGDLSAAQQAYTTLQQDFEQFAQSHGLQTTQGSSSASSANGLSVTA